MNLNEFQKLEQVKALYRHMPIALGGVFAVSLLTVVLLWNNFDQSLLLSWFAGAMVLLLLRIHSYYRYAQSDVDTSNTRKWLKEVVFWSFLSGISWGLVTILFVNPEQPIYTLFLTCVFAGYISGSTPALSMYMPAFMAFVMPLSLMFFGQSVYLGGETYYSIAISIVVYIVIIVSFARRTQADFLRTAQLTFENKALIKEVTDQKETAENAVLAKNQFLAAASHDLRQPLHALGLFIDSLQALKLGSSAELIISKISQSTQAINGLLHGLLDISRLDADVVENRPQHIDFNFLIGKLAKEYERSAAEKDIEWGEVFQDDLVVYSDPMLLERILRNLIDNAVKFTNAGMVEIKANNEENYVLFEVKDTGPGIPLLEQENVFSEFTQLDNPERDRSKGLGLGLAIVKRLCDLTKIELVMDSQKGVGSAFSLKVAKGKLENVSEHEAGETITLKDRVIIVIDDEVDILEGMRAILASGGANVIVAIDVTQAIISLDQLNVVPDLIIADFRLRDNTNGIDAIAKIRDEYNRDIKAVLVTGDTSPDRLLLAQSSQLPILHKPVESKVLLRKIDELLKELAN